MQRYNKIQKPPRGNSEYFLINWKACGAGGYFARISYLRRRLRYFARHNQT